MLAEGIVRHSKRYYATAQILTQTIPLALFSQLTPPVNSLVFEVNYLLFFISPVVQLFVF